MNSISKAQVKHIRLLQQKKYRQKYRQFVVEGLKSVQEFLQSKFKASIIVSTNKWIEDNEKAINASISMANNEVFQKLSSQKNPSGILGVFEMKEKNNIDFNTNLALYLDDIRDPGNLGTIIRTADWFGLNQIFCSPKTADCFNAKVIQASMGSLAHISVNYCEIDILIKEDFEVVIADLDGINYKELECKNKYVLVIGNEANGINSRLKRKANFSITIPKKGNAESLNAAISTGILLEHFS